MVKRYFTDNLNDTFSNDTYYDEDEEDIVDMMHINDNKDTKDMNEMNDVVEYDAVEPFVNYRNEVVSVLCGDKCISR